MNIRVLAMAAALFALLVPLHALAAAPATEIAVMGEGVVTLSPDDATVEASITTNDPSADRAVSQNNAAYASVLSRLSAAGIAKSDVQTAYFNASYVPPPEPVEPAAGAMVRPRPAERHGYIANRSLTITVRDTKAVGRVIDNLVANANVTIGNVAFGIRDRRSAYRSALARAVHDAQTQAQSLSSAANLHIVRIKSLQEGGISAPPVPLMRTMAAAAPAPVPTDISPGNVEVRATVTLIYEARP